MSARSAGAYPSYVSPCLPADVAMHRFKSGRRRTELVLPSMRHPSRNVWFAYEVPNQKRLTIRRVVYRWNNEFKLWQTHTATYQDLLEYSQRFAALALTLPNIGGWTT